MKNEAKELLLKCVIKRNHLSISANLKEQSNQNTDIIDENILLFEEIISYLESECESKPDSNTKSKLNIDDVSNNDAKESSSDGKVAERTCHTCKFTMQRLAICKRCDDDYSQYVRSDY